MYQFRLYIIKGTAKTYRLIKSLKLFLQNKYNNNYILEIMSKFTHTKEAEMDNVFVAPTLIKKAPPPEIKIVGDLKDSEKMQNILCM